MAPSKLHMLQLPVTESPSLWHSSQGWQYCLAVPRGALPSAPQPPVQHWVPQNIFFFLQRQWELQDGYNARNILFMVVVLVKGLCLLFVVIVVVTAACLRLLVVVTGFRLFVVVTAATHNKILAARSYTERGNFRRWARKIFSSHQSNVPTQICGHILVAIK